MSPVVRYIAILLLLLPTLGGVSRDKKVEEFVATYWHGFDFSHSDSLATGQFERVFSRYLAMLGHVETHVAKSSITALLDSAAVNPASLRQVISLSEKYLYEPSSPQRNEELYITMLEGVIAHDSLRSIEKILPEYQLRNALKNRVGEVATDFDITLQSGASLSLHSIEAAYIILLFNNPDCSDCARVKEFISSQPHLFNRPEVRVVAIYPDEDLSAWRGESYPSWWINGYNTSLISGGLYHLQAIPTIYLLDASKRVVAKDITAEQLSAIGSTLRP